MKQYTDLLRRILEEGRRKENRTGVDTISLIGPQMEFNLDDGFPIVTERPIFFRGCVAENLWFIDGLCNNEDLVAQKVNIWSSWALKEDVIEEMPRQTGEIVSAYIEHRRKSLPEGTKFTFEDAVRELTLADKEDMEKGLPVNGKTLDAKSDAELQGGYRLLREAGIPLVKSEVIMGKGYLGPVYGVLWRGWIDQNGRPIDQFKNIFEKLASDNPKLRYSRANIITSYNPGVLPDETVSPQDNVLAGRQALAACHTMFQFFAEPMTRKERFALCEKLGLVTDEIQNTYNVWFDGEFAVHPRVTAAECAAAATLLDMAFDQLDIAKDQLSLKLYQRSADFPVGVPFNIAGYALLLHMFCAQLNMKPAKFIHTFGDAHIYVNQIEGVHELLGRESPPLPTLWLNPSVDSIFKYTTDDIKLVGYEPVKPDIKFAVAV